MTQATTTETPLVPVPTQSTPDFHAIYDQAPDAILLQTLDSGRIVEANATACRMFGRTLDELRGADIGTVSTGAPPYTQEDALPWFRKAVRNGPQLFEWLCRGEAGRTFWVEFHLARCTLGENDGLLAIVRNITERKRGHEQLGRIRAALEDATDAFVIMDSNGEVVYANRGFSDLFAHSAASIGDTGIASIFADRDVARRVFQTTLNWGSWSGEVDMISRDGRRFPALARATPILDDQMPTVGILLIFNDISERKQLEAQLLQARKLESIGQLAAGIAHEINTPTQYIGDNIRFLQNSFIDLASLLERYAEMAAAARIGNVPAELTAQVEAAVAEADIEYLTTEIPLAIQQAMEGVDRVTEIVRAMKEFSHPGVNDKTEIDINKAIMSTFTVARNEWKYVADVVTELAPDLPLVACCPGEFNQVILNILVNAAHAIGDVVGDASQGKGTITVRTRRDGKWIEIQISDTGAGIPAAVQPKVFDPFFTTKPVGKGTGQGLAIAHSVIVEKHNGSIRFETREGEGTTFIVRIPVAMTPAARAKEATLA